MGQKSISRINSVLIHTLFWTGYLAFLVFVLSGREAFERSLAMGFIQIVPQIALAYLNMEILIPVFFAQKKYVAYVALVFLSFIGIYYFYEFIMILYFQYAGPPPGPVPGRMMRGRMPVHFFSAMRGMRIAYVLSQTMAIFFLSTAYKISRIAAKKEREAAVLRSENLNAELKFLRSQINPHFLFNALNNIYALAVTKSEQTPDMILKLSNMLRYILYDCNADRVPLGKEIGYINDYVDMQKLKDDQITNVEIDYSGADPDTMIAPMILIPFIENAFKHSQIEDVGHGWIKVKIETGAGRLRFSVSNSKAKSAYSKDRVGGIGLENVKRRLELLYPQRHELIIKDTPEAFMVELGIVLEKS